MELRTRSAGRCLPARRWARRASYAVLSLLALAYVVPLALGLSRVDLLDDSMEPAIGRGSAVFAKRVDVARLELGDVISYRPDIGESEERVTRRIVGTDGAALSTRGDNRAHEEPRPFIPTSSTHPRAVWYVPLAGYAFAALRVPAVLGVTIGLPVGLLALLSLWDAHDVRRRRRPVTALVPLVAAPPRPRAAPPRVPRQAGAERSADVG